MNNGQKLARARHLETVANGAKRYTLAGMSMIVDAISAELVDFTGATSATAGTGGFVPAPSIADRNKFLRGDGQWALFTIGTASSTVEGAFWLEDD